MHVVEPERVRGERANWSVYRVPVCEALLEDLTERYHLMDDGSRLRRQIVLRGKNGEEVINFQTYQRDSD